MLVFRRAISTRGIPILSRTSRLSGVTAAVAATLVAVGAATLGESICAKTDPNALEIPKSKEETFCDVNCILQETAKILVAQLLYLEMDQPGVPITMYITSGGGLVYAGLAIYDIMQHISSPVHTVCIGHAESMAAILLASGEPGCRSALPHGRIMLHQPSLGVSRTTAQDVMIQAVEGQNTKRRLVDLVAKHTGKPAKEVEDAIERNNYMAVEEAMKFNLIDSYTKQTAPPVPSPANGTSSLNADGKATKAAFATEDTPEFSDKIYKR